mgnify:CR=1 FL=1
MKTKNTPLTVVVTGASAGVGRAVVREFTRQKAHIGLIARGKDRLESAKRESEEGGGKALVMPTYVAAHAAFEAVAARVENELGPLGICVTDTSTTRLAPFLAILSATFNRASVDTSGDG